MAGSGTRSMSAMATLRQRTDLDCGRTTQNSEPVPLTGAINGWRLRLALCLIMQGKIRGAEGAGWFATFIGYGACLGSQ